MTFPRAALAGLICCAAFAAPATGQELTDGQAAEAMDFAMHDAAFTLFHEIGHLLVGELGLPVLGKEEDAADALAVILLLNDTSDEIESFNTLIDSADGWYFNAVKSTGEGLDDLSFYDEHSLDIQRAYAMVCMMVGFNQKEFGETADIYEIDKERQESCAFTYQQAANSWTTLLEPHFAADAAGAGISVSYEEAGDFADFAAELQDRRVLEKAAELVVASFVLPRPVTFRAALCGEANAYYDPDAAEILYCYELAANMHELYVENVVAQADEAAVK